MTKEFDPKEGNWEGVEAFYDAEIAPKLLEAATLCHQHGIPFLSMVQYGPDLDRVGETRSLPNHANETMHLVGSAMRVRGNIDSLVIQTGKRCRESDRPHSSIVLQQMGIDPDPTKR